MKIHAQLLTVITVFSLTLVQPYKTVIATSTDASRIATGITVKIESQNTGSIGSGVLISRRENIYSVLTCWHVVDSNSPLVITTPDGQRHTVQSRSIKRVDGTLDLAIADFSSNTNYNLAKVGDSEKVQAGESAYVAGFPRRSDARQDSLLVIVQGVLLSAGSRD